MSLSDEQLLRIYWEPCSTVEDDSPLIRGLRAVAEAAVQAEREVANPIAYVCPNALQKVVRGIYTYAEIGARNEVRTQPVFASPQASATVPDARWKPILEAVMREMPRSVRHYRLDDGNAPGHGHQVAGTWDSDNGDLAGKPCAWCLAWNTAKAMLAAAHEAKRVSCSQTAKKSTHEVGRVDETGKSEQVGGVA